ncbi:Eco57I restriction-modification methylase domain-containing protein [Chryseobacterium indologenes]|uniref:Eco57I restriction-modification methylase domain-containing protein n=1 Tax=Chryseobacterium indologenes TaxID=253 RepID=UPI000F4FEF22|nr:TaqI-like C-terminal specificity domain-containing protein [Chryseobacterium indologenes]AYY85371.1 class I SAM-dependent DNA methyltransferase [Chryseobacterium indologenes]
MKPELLKGILQRSYDTAQWIQILMFIAKNKNILTLFVEPKEIKLTSKREQNICTEILQLGQIKTSDGEIMPIFEIALQPTIKIENNKVAVNELVKNHIVKDAINAALVTFYSPNSDRSEWRFSFVSKSSANEYFIEVTETKETNPKKYTYIFGTSETHKTAIDRLYALHQSSLSLDDFFEAFNVEPVSKGFFTEYKHFFLDLVDELKNNYYSTFIVRDENTDNEDKLKTEAEIRNFVKRLLGRIIFLYFLQKKSWLGATNTEYKDGDTNFLQGLFNNTTNKEQFYSEILSNLFFNTLNKVRDNDLYTLPDGTQRCIPFLNGGLFEEDHEPTEHRQITFPVHQFEDLFNFLNSYNFTIYENSPEEHTVAVDPEMLGHIFENLLEDNKDKGAFYTPKEIVHYMTQQSLLEYLKTHTTIEGDKLENFIINNICTGFTHIDLEEIEKYIDKVKICDPAIGSGAFPMGLLQEIFALKAQINYELQRDNWNPAKIKQNIIQNSIYGVDIEPGAVDIARLRFWLSLVVDEEIPQPLPNLDYKIMQGDSLVESYEGINLGNIVKGNDLQIAEMQTDLFGNYTDDQMKITVTKTGLAEEIQTLIEEYFTAKTEEKSTIKTSINQKVHEHIDYNLELRENQLQRQIGELEGVKTLNSKQQKFLQNLNEELVRLNNSRSKLHTLQNKQEKPFFLWSLFFSDVFNHGGFDIVIGNPPYIQLQKSSGRLSQILEKLDYKTFARTGDIYSIFYEKGWQILKEKGILCYITSNKWMRAAYGELTRKFFAEKTNPIILIDFAGQKIFESATVDTNILLFSKDKNRQQTKACIVKEKVLNNLSDYFRQNAINTDFNSSESWVVLSPIEKQIKEKIETIGTPLKDWDIKINYGIKTGYNEAFIIDDVKRKELIDEDPRSAEVIRPILRGRDIKRYSYDFANLWLINTHNGIKEKDIKRVEINDYPAIKKYLSQFYLQLEKRTDKGDTPYNLRNCAYMEEFYRQKIVWKIIGSNINFLIDSNGYFYNNAANILTSTSVSLEALIAFLNSKLFEWYFKKIIFIEVEGGGIQMFNTVMEKIPIPIINSEKKDKLIKAVNKLLKFKLAKDCIETLDNEINIMIYELLNLTKEEIEFIELQ